MEWGCGEKDTARVLWGLPAWNTEAKQALWVYGGNLHEHPKGFFFWVVAWRQTEREENCFLQSKHHWWTGISTGLEVLRQNVYFTTFKSSFNLECNGLTAAHSATPFQYHSGHWILIFVSYMIMLAPLIHSLSVYLHITVKTVCADQNNAITRWQNILNCGSCTPLSSFCCVLLWCL